MSVDSASTKSTEAGGGEFVSIRIRVGEIPDCAGIDLLDFRRLER